MKIKAWQIVIVGGILIVGGWGWNKMRVKSSKQDVFKIVSPYQGNMEIIISATGRVLPKNRLQVKPPVNGRIEQVLVVEGQKIKAGETLAWMSSTDRAALLDAARGRGEAALKEWQDVYKPIPLISPIDGEVIVGTIQPGQTVTTADDVVVLSDRLIVRAQVDETDIGKIQNGQLAVLTLDAYPDIKINAVVNHIYYESQTVNNVTIYDVDLLPDSIPSFFRSGMNANIDFIVESKKNVLLLTAAAIQKEKGQAFVMTDNGLGKKFLRRDIQLGLSDEKNTEILSGLTASDQVILMTQKYSLPKGNGGTNPFMPNRRK
jgi:macrolide-specific efflux system membrane fusion protein